MRILKSVIAAESLAEIAAKQYDLALPVRSRLLSVNDNDTYLIDSGNVEWRGARHVLRVYRYRKHWIDNPANYRFELDWLVHLHDQGHPVSYPIARRNGELLGVLHAPEGERYYALFSFAPGKIFWPMSVEQCHLFGADMARIHQASNTFQTLHPRGHQNLEWILDRPVGRIEAFLGDRRPEDLVFLQDLVTSIKQSAGSLPHSAPFYGIIGGDFHGGNHFITDDNMFTYFDFDLCGYGWRAYDLAVYWWSTKRSSASPELWQAALEGYESVRPLIEEERQALPALVNARQIWLMGSHTDYIDSGGDEWLGDRYWDSNFGYLKQWVKNEGSPLTE